MKTPSAPFKVNKIVDCSKQQPKLMLEYIVRTMTEPFFWPLDLVTSWPIYRNHQAPRFIENSVDGSSLSLC
ncbi:unnamed protein product [Absidia cylindrospora]